MFMSMFVSLPCICCLHIADVALIRVNCCLRCWMEWAHLLSELRENLRFVVADFLLFFCACCSRSIDHRKSLLLFFFFFLQHSFSDCWRLDDSSHPDKHSFAKMTNHAPYISQNTIRRCFLCFLLLAKHTVEGNIHAHASS